MLEAPGRVSTTTVWPHCSVIFGPRTGAMMSVEPPGANGTMILIGLSGYLSATLCATAVVARPAVHSAPTNVAKKNAPARCLMCSSLDEAYPVPQRQCHPFGAATLKDSRTEGMA